MKHSTLIKRSKNYLALDWHDRWHQDKSYYVCIAISTAGMDLNEEDKAEDICKLIENRLGQYDTISDWLWDKIRVSEINLLYNDSIIQNYRLKWMDSLANEYKRAGK